MRSQLVPMPVLILVVAALSPAETNAVARVGDPSAPISDIGGVVDSSGLTIVGPEPIQAGVMPDRQRSIWEAAYSLAMENPEDFAYPWVESGTETIRLRPASDLGRTLASAAARAFDPGLEVMQEESSVSIANLDRLADSITRLNEAGLLDADLIWRTEPDHLNNRIIVTIAEERSGLMKSLAARYGTTRLAVRIEAAPSDAGPGGRDSDSPWFWGGAAISTPIFSGCTTGFAWTASTKKSMLFAGHCAFTGGKMSYPNYPNVGGVSVNTEENWSKLNGTTFFQGQTVYRGDLALIRYYEHRSNHYVYTGAAHTSTSSRVDTWAWSAEGDAICVNGAADGENCGAVQRTGVSVNYTAQGPAVDGTNVWLRNAVEAFPGQWNQCPIPGDSGAPVYKRQADGTLIAKGIWSGSASGPLGCKFWYTDIMLAIAGLPGYVQTIHDP